MAYFINPVGEDRCVFLSYEGDMPAVELSAGRCESDAMLDQRQWHRLVVDITQLQSAPKTSELISFASRLSSSVSRSRRVALVVRPEQERLARLIQKVARRGRMFLACFQDPDKATLWVKQSTPHRQVLGRNRRESV
jgi:sugar diacid utilization regulator